MKTTLKRGTAVWRTARKVKLGSILAEALPKHRFALELILGKANKDSRCRAERLRLFFEMLGPIFIKFGQLLSTRPDLLPSDISLELRKLQDNVPPYPSEQFIARVESSLGQPTSELFSYFDPNPLASASVAQVHRATLPNGREVVVKALRPDLVPIVEQDITLMRSIAKLMERMIPESRRLRPVEVIDEYQTTIQNELDLRIEAANASLTRRNFTPVNKLYIPELHWDYCTKEVMVSEYIDGIPVNDIDQLNAQHTNLKVLAERGVDIFFTQVFEHNFFHADMHPGNIFVSREHPENPIYMAVDCAVCGSLTREDQYYMARNMLAIFRRDYRQVAELHIDCGWVPADTSINDFETTIRTLCEPIFEKPFGEISFAGMLMALFDAARKYNMTVQPQLVLLQKTLLNIEGLGRQLYPQLDLWNTAHPYLEKWLKRNFSPASVWTDFKRYGPDWLEKFPKVPNLIFNALQNASQTPTPETNAATKRGGISILGLAAGAIGVILGTQIDVSNELLIVLSAFTLGWLITKIGNRGS